MIGGRLFRCMLRSDVERLQALEHEISDLKEQAILDREELVRLRTGLLRLDRELKLNMDQIQKTVTGLLQRIESLRRDRTDRCRDPAPVPNTTHKERHEN